MKDAQDRFDGLGDHLAVAGKPKRPLTLPQWTKWTTKTIVRSERGPFRLENHTKGVEMLAKRYAERCGLGTAMVEDIALAARLHDLGKFDERFQAWLYGRPFAGGDYLAKSGGRRSMADNRRLRDAAKYPAGARHEAGSVLAACALGALERAHDKDLVLYLIGVHHGYGRPFFPVWEKDAGYRFVVRHEGAEVECGSGWQLARIDSGWVDRFWNLNRKYGYWGLAYLEGILRRADCMRSRWEEINGGD